MRVNRPAFASTVPGGAGAPPPPPAGGSLDASLDLASRTAEPAALPRAWPESSSSTAGRFSPAVAAVILGASGIATLLAPGVASAAEELASRAVEVPVSSAVTETLGRMLNGPTASTITVPTATEPSLAITGSVGVGAQNNAADVTVVQQRLKDLGFDIKVDGKFGSGTAKTIRIFESLLNGKESIAENTGRIEPGSALAAALASPNAPQWVAMPKSGTGFVNVDADGFSWGSSTMRDVLIDAGSRYQEGWLATHPGASVINVNDVSRRAGGPNRDHETHEAGLDADIRLPRTDGTAGSRVGWKSYDRDAAEAIVKAFASDPRVERVIIGDWTLLQRIEKSDAPWKNKVVAMSDHKTHIHVDVRGVNVDPNLPPIVE